MFRSDKNEVMLRMAKMLSLLYSLMGTTRLVDVVWVDIISMEILHTGILPILSSTMQVFSIGMLPILTSMIQ